MPDDTNPTGSPDLRSDNTDNVPLVGNQAPGSDNVEITGDEEEDLDHTGGADGISHHVTERDREYVSRHADTGQAQPRVYDPIEEPREGEDTFSSAKPG